MTSEQFFASDNVQNLIRKYKRTTTLLRPHRSDSPINQSESKFGGIPNFAGFESYPHCTACQSPLNFVLQLYKKDFPSFYFPDSSNRFQLFRCPNHACPDTYSEQSDHTMFHFYFNVIGTEDKEYSRLEFDIQESERPVPDCYLKPTLVYDYPKYADFEGNDFVALEKKFGDEFADLFTAKFTAHPNTKFGGYPSYTQAPVYPTCSCGKTKEFFFQLSSEDIEDGIEYPPPHDKWSPHGIMIGDVGNIYFYVCKSCGSKTIESNWDCS